MKIPSLNIKFLNIIFTLTKIKNNNKKKLISNLSNI